MIDIEMTMQLAMIFKRIRKHFQFAHLKNRPKNKDTFEMSIHRLQKSWYYKHLLK